MRKMKRNRKETKPETLTEASEKLNAVIQTLKADILETFPIKEISQLARILSQKLKKKGEKNGHND